MNIDPLSVALQEINETTQILESLLLASESFNYCKAKEAVKSLRRKTREIGKLKARFQRFESLRAPNIRVIDFKADRAFEKRS